MKKILFSMFVLLPFLVSARVIYVSNSGSDVNNGLTTGAAWQTLDKVNASMLSNDTILFERNGSWLGYINVKANTVRFGAYGSGAKPEITGFVNVGSWVADGSMPGVYKAPVSGFKNWQTLVTINGVPQQMGRYPNSDAANGGYLMFTGKSGNTSITDTKLTTNWTGADICIRGNDWNIDWCKITSQAGSVINYVKKRGIIWTTPLLSLVKDGHGYFIMNDKRTLDKNGEWWLDTTASYLYVYNATGAPTGVQISVVDTLFKGNGYNGLYVENIVFKGGGTFGVVNSENTLRGNPQTFTVKNCDFVNIGAKGIYSFNITNVLIEGVTCNNALSTGIYALNRTRNNITIRNCIVKNTALLRGMASHHDGSDGLGIMAHCKNGSLTVENNRIDSSSNAGMNINGVNVIVRRNFVTNYCIWLIDQGGIYTFIDGKYKTASLLPVFFNRTISENTVLYGIGDNYGTPGAGSIPRMAGIYLDGNALNVDVLNNTVGYIPKNAFHCNNPNNVRISGNTAFNCLNFMSFFEYSWGELSNFRLTNNKFGSVRQDARLMYYTNDSMKTSFAVALQEPVIDSNFYCTYNPLPYRTEFYQYNPTAVIYPAAPMSVDYWKAISGNDANSFYAPTLPLYTILSPGANKALGGGSFTSNATGYTVFGTGTTGSFDNSGQINGGSLKVSLNGGTADRYSLIYSAVGSVSKSAKYLIKFKTKGTTGNGILKVYIRRTASPYDAITAEQYGVFGTSVKQHEFLFKPTTDVVNGNFVIAVEQKSGTLYIDDVSFSEATAGAADTVNLVVFRYNETASPKTIDIPGKYMLLQDTSVKYNNSITLSAYTSAILLRDTTTSGAPPAAPVGYTTFQNTFSITKTFPLAGTWKSNTGSVYTGKITLSAGQVVYLKQIAVPKTNKLTQ